MTDGLGIFDDVHEVPTDAVAATAVQVVLAVLGYALILGIVVVLVVRLVEVLWPVLVVMVFPWFMNPVVAVG